MTGGDVIDRAVWNSRLRDLFPLVFFFFSFSPLSSNERSSEAGNSPLKESHGWHWTANFTILQQHHSEPVGNVVLHIARMHPHPPPFPFGASPLRLCRRLARSTKWLLRYSREVLRHVGTMRCGSRAGGKCSQVNSVGVERACHPIYLPIAGLEESKQGCA